MLQKSVKRFVPLTKVEDQPDGTIKVWGYCSSEAEDSDGDVIKASAMAAAMPEYMKFGNLREMHQNIAAGTVFEWDVLEDGRTFIGANVVDEGSIKKVKKGVLKGFSIGGDGTECEPDNPKCITALVLNEISLVDRPANPDAVISLWKAKKMATPEATPLSNEQAVEAIATELNSGVPPQLVLDLLKRHKELNKESGSAGAEDPKNNTTGSAKAAAQHGSAIASEPDADNNAKNKAEGSGHYENGAAPNLGKATGENDDGDDESGMSKAVSTTQVPGSEGYHKVQAHDGEHADCQECTKLKKAHDAAMEEKADEEGEAMENYTKAHKDSDKPYGDVEYADPGYQEDGKKRYPIDTEAHIRAAWNYINKEKNAGKYSGNQVSKIKARIVAAWKAKIDPEGPPSAKEKAMPTGKLQKNTDVNTANGTAKFYPTVGAVVMLVDGNFTHTAKINELGDGTARVESDTFEVTVDLAALKENDAESNEGNVQWVTTMDQAHDWVFKQGNAEMLDSGVSHYDNNGSKNAAAAPGKLTKRALKKGMYDIVDFAYIMMSINSLESCMAYEQMAEKDPDSKALAALKAWCAAGKQVFMTIITEELGEMGTAEDLDVMAVVIEQAANSGILQKSLGMFLENAGVEAISSMHEFTAIKLAKMAPGNLLQKAVDSGDPKSIAKALMAQNESLAKKVEDLTGEVTALKALPLAGAVQKSANAGGKSADTLNPADDVAPVVVPGGEVDKAATAFKKAFMGGGTNLFNLQK